jgi:hypothetical protein
MPTENDHAIAFEPDYMCQNQSIQHPSNIFEDLKISCVLDVGNCKP